MIESLIPAGEYADICLPPDGVPVITCETSQRDGINVLRGTSGQQQIAYCDGAFIGSQKMGLFPRIAVNPDGQIAVAYQRGPSICLSLIGAQQDIVIPADEEPFGVEMCCVAWIDVEEEEGFWRLAYVARWEPGYIQLVMRDYDRAGTLLATETEDTDTTQGISRVLPDGAVVLVDATASAFGISRPWEAGALLIGQGNTAPARVIGYLNGDMSRPYRIFDGLAYRPRAVETSPGQWTVMATGTQGIRVTEVPPFTLDVVEPPVEPPAPERPRVTITAYTQEGYAPLVVRVTVRLSGGEARELVVRAMGSDSTQATIPDPITTTQIQFSLRTPGRYTLQAIVTGPGGTDSTDPLARIVTVHPQPEEPMPTTLPPYPDEPTTITAYLEKVRLLYVEAGRVTAEDTRPPDWGAFKWITRWLDNYKGGMTVEAAWSRVEAELRAELGLPPR